MVSNTKQTERRRRMKAATTGRAQKRERTKVGTPKFPIHPEGAVASAAPAAAPKKAAAPKAAAKPAAAAKKA